MANSLGTFDKMMFDIISSSNESVAHDFKVGSVKKLKSKKVLKTLEADEETDNVIEPKVKEPNDDFKEGYEIGGIDTNVEEFLTESITKANLIIFDLEKNKKVLSAQVEELRQLGEFERAKNLRYSYKSIEYALDDLKDAIELAKFLIE